MPGIYWLSALIERDLYDFLLFRNSKDEKVVEKMIYGAELGNLQWLKHWQINFEKNLRDMLVPCYLYVDKTTNLDAGLSIKWKYKIEKE